MKEITLAILYLTLCMVPILTIVNAKPHERTGIELCKDVSVEINKSVKADLLTAEEASDIVNRCFTLFGGDA